MNVLRKDISYKPGARSKTNRNDITNMATVNTARFANNARTFHSRPAAALPTVEESDSSPTTTTTATTANYDPRLSAERPSHHALNRTKTGEYSEFQACIQPFVAEVQRPNTAYPRGKEHDNQMDNARFKTPIVAQTSRLKDETGSTSDVLRVLGDSYCTPDQSKEWTNLSYRPPVNELDIEKEEPGEVRRNPAFSGASDISSIKANTTTSSEKKTPRNSSKVQKTPRTTSSMLERSDVDAPNTIIAITEGRGHASGEVGIAAMDPSRPHLVLCQISDSQRYTKTLTKLNVLHFVEVIVPNTFADGPTPRKLYMDILDRFPSVTVNKVQRRHFSEPDGLQMIQQYCSRESESVMVVVRDKFYALSAAAALLKYIVFTQSILFAPASLKIEYQGTEGTTIIDLDTANRLELVLGIVSREERHSLLGVLKHCKTKGGVRLLRANLLQPYSDPTVINARLDCVAELVENPILYNAIESVISQMKNAESLLSLCMHPPQQSGLKAAQFQLKYVMLLKTTLELVPALANALGEATSDYFRTTRENLGDVRITSIVDRIHKTIIQGTPGNRPGAFNTLAACFMICTGINGLLDIAKKTYCELAQEITDLVEALRSKLDLPLRMAFTQGKGYHIVISPITDVPDPLPSELILAQKSRTSIICFTAELVALDQRCQQALHEIELMTNVLLFELLNDIREHISCLYPLCESIAELDVCLTFAQVGAVDGYVRPTFADTLDIRGARHPILDVMCRERIVANDVFADIENNFVILTGPNQSGKSIYIRQIALLHTMAQVGCYVPAVSAQFRIADRIFSRIGFDDSIEGNSSTLMVELQDMEFIGHNLTKNSLVIVDELCRGTSIEEGTALAFSICEQLIDTTAFVFFTTHFLFVAKLEQMYSNVRNYHFETQLSGDENPTLKYTHRMIVGVTPEEQYGIRLAQLMGYIDSILECAKQCAEVLLLECKPHPQVCAFTTRYQISQKLRGSLPQSDDATFEQIQPILRQYRDRYKALPAESGALLALLTDMPHASEESRKDSEVILPSPGNSESRVEILSEPSSSRIVPSTPLNRVCHRENTPEADVSISDSIVEQSIMDAETREEGTQQSSQPRVEDSVEGDIQCSESDKPSDHEMTESEGSKLLEVMEEEQASENSERTHEVALMLLSFRQGPEHPKKKTRKPIPRTTKRLKVDELVQELGADLPAIANKSPYYEWKFSKDKKALKTLATARRASPAVSLASRGDSEGLADSVPLSEDGGSQDKEKEIGGRNVGQSLAAQGSVNDCSQKGEQ